MTVRALIVAIDEYKFATTLPAGGLDDVAPGAIRFRDWLIARKGAKASDIHFCAKEGTPGRTAGTTRSDISNTLGALVDSGRDTTEELYVYLSGHGFSYPREHESPPLDVLICSEFHDPETSGGACIQLREVQYKLLQALGPGQHFYFVDACRNPIKPEAIDVPSLGRKFGRSVFREPTVFTLFSTSVGTTATVGGGFVRALLNGLHGAGRAKVWIGADMCVMFEPLCTFVKECLRPEQTPKSDRIGDAAAGRILTLQPIPTSECVVEVDGAAADDAFTIQSQKPTDDRWENESFRGCTTTIRRKPHDYFLRLTYGPLGDVPLKRVEPAPQSESDMVDLYDSRRVRFVKEPAEPLQHTFSEAAVFEAPPLPRPAQIEVNLPGQATIRLRNLQDNATFDVHRTQRLDVPAGHYEIKVRELGVTIDKREVNLYPGVLEPFHFPGAPRRRAQISILDHAVEHSPETVGGWFSEKLGQMANQDLSLLLAILGASRIVGMSSPFAIPADGLGPRFDTISPGEAPVFVLLASDSVGSAPRVALSRSATVKWVAARPVRGLTDVYQAAFRVQPGARLLSFQMGGSSPVTVSIVGLPNRATFLTVADDDLGRTNIHQFLLPLGHLRDHLDEHVRRRFDDEPLRLVRMMALAQRQFARRKTIEPEGSGMEDWKELAHAKWFDPVMSLIAAFQILRQGRLKDARGLLKFMVANLRRYFPGLADTEALARRIGMSSQPVSHAPLLLDSLRALEMEDALALPSHRLDYDSPWVAWRAAINDASA